MTEEQGIIKLPDGGEAMVASKDYQGFHHDLALVQVRGAKERLVKTLSTEHLQKKKPEVTIRGKERYHKLRENLKAMQKRLLG